MAFEIGAALGKQGFNVVDVETTGLNTQKDRIIEIAVVHVHPDGSIGETWTTLINPQTEVGASHIHGITEEKIKDAPLFEELAPYLYHKLAGLPLVAHNARFDAEFITAELIRAGLHSFGEELPRIDTIELAKSLITLPNYRLETCCSYFDISLTHAHCALDDTLACAKLFAQLLKLRKDMSFPEILRAENMVWDVPDEINEPRVKLR